MRYLEKFSINAIPEDIDDINRILRLREVGAHAEHQGDKRDRNVTIVVPVDFLSICFDSKMSPRDMNIWQWLSLTEECIKKVKNNE